MADEDYEEADPALKDFNAPAVGVMHIGGGAAKGAIKGALITGLGVLALGMVAGALPGIGLAFLGPVGMFFAPVVSAVGAIAGGGVTAALGGVVGAAIFGAKIGAAIGGASALLNVGEAIEDAKDAKIEESDRRMMRMANLEQIQMRREGLRRSLGGQDPSAPTIGMGMGRAGLGRV